MLNLVKILSASTDDLQRRVVKFLRYGKSDIQTAVEAAPFGTDANPIKDMVAIYAPTGEKGKQVIIGYLNKNQLSEPGEHRIFSTDANGEEKFYIWLRNNGNCEIGGDQYNAVRYQPLDEGLQNLVTSLQLELGKIQTSITSLGGTYTPGTLQLNIEDSKIDKIKTL